MKKSTIGSLHIPQKLPIVFCYLVATSMFAQNADDVKVVQQQTDLKGLMGFSKNLRKSTMSVSTLKQRAEKLRIPFSGESKGRYYQLRGFDKNNKPLYYVTYNADAARSVGVSKLQSESGFNLQGDGITLFEWDGGAVRLNHQEFGDRVTQKDVATLLNSHSTHVAGTMVASGIDKKAKGMAPKAKLNTYDWDNDKNEMIEASANDGALISNHSYGLLGGFEYGDWSGETGWHWMGKDEDTEFIGYGRYGDEDKQQDLISLKAPYYLPVKAAGNPRGDAPDDGDAHYVRVKDDNQYVWQESYKQRQKNGGEDGFDCLNQGANAKNVLVVGAAHKIRDGYQTPSDVKAVSFSAFGPTDDGRIKPDIMGIGADIYSTTSRNVSSYDISSGTSMASPNVAGTLALLQEYYKKMYGTENQPFMKSATLKALAIHTASESGDAPGPDYKFGWGLINPFKAVQALSVKDKYSKIEEAKLNNSEKYTLKVVASGKEPLVVTIVWDDAVVDNLPEETLNNRQSVLVNDLDLRILTDSETFQPWILDPNNPSAVAIKGDNKKDNVEQVVIENPIAGQEYTISVSHKGQLKNNDGSNLNLVKADYQNFSLIATGIRESVTKDLSLKSITVPQVKEYSKNTPITAEIENLSTENITGAKLKFTLTNADNEGEEVQTGEIELAEIAKNSVSTATFNIDLSVPFVNYSISAEILLDGDEVPSNNINTALAYGIIADITEVGSSHSFDFEDDWQRNGWTFQDLDNNARTWTPYDDTDFARSGRIMAANFPNSQTGTDDWLFSNPIKVKAGKLYKVEFYLRKFQKIEEELEVFVGNTPDSSSMNKKIKGNIVASADGKYHNVSIEFTADADEILYLGFHHQSDAQTYAVGVDDFSIRYAEGKPIIGFYANRKSATTYETISFVNETNTASTQPATYEWIFTPDTVEYQDGTSSSSENPKVRFTEEGYYTVTLKATNVKGTSTEEKENLIEIKNTPTVARFTSSALSILEGETVAFTNSSRGNPEPEEYEWNITPTEGVEYVSDTSASSEDIVVRFSKYGTYNVFLKAKSIHNEDTSSPLEIKVLGIHEAVKNFKSDYNEESKLLNLTWETPNMVPIYSEDFDNGIPAEITIVNVNNDNYTWKTSAYHNHSGRYGVASYCWWFGFFNADDWLISPKLRSGAEVLKYMAKHDQPTRYDVYVVEATSETVPSVEEIKANGHKVYQFDLGEPTKDDTYESRMLNIKDYTEKDFFVAFHHRTTKEDQGFYLALDDIQVGYDDGLTQKQSVNQSIKNNAHTDLKLGEKIVSLSKMEDPTTTNTTISTPVEFGILNAPQLTGYEIMKNGTLLANISGRNQLSYTETISENGTYTYDIYAVYSDGQKSDKESLIVNIANLSVNETMTVSGVKIYPNPSDGIFTVEDSQASRLKVEVYDLSGKLIFKKDYDSNNAIVNLTNQPKGVYIVNLVNDKDEKQTSKIIIK